MTLSDPRQDHLVLLVTSKPCSLLELCCLREWKKKGTSRKIRAIRQLRLLRRQNYKQFISYSNLFLLCKHDIFLLYRIKQIANSLPCNYLNYISYIKVFPYPTTARSNTGQAIQHVLWIPSSLFLKDFTSAYSFFIALEMSLFPLAYSYTEDGEAWNMHLTS